MFSYVTGYNFTITKGTDDVAGEPGVVGNILLQEPGSTVKHVDWVWPECLVGDGGKDGGSQDMSGRNNSGRGPYNVSYSFPNGTLLPLISFD